MSSKILLDPDTCRKWRVLVETKGYIDLSTPNGCWLWRGELNEKGYGRSKILIGRKARVHRIMYVATIGPIDEGMEVDHKCHTRTCLEGSNCIHRRCINPSHLEMVTHQENTLRGATIVADLSRRTQCPKGHPLIEGNLVPSTLAQGRRGCLVCQKEQMTAIRAARQILNMTNKGYGAEFGWSTATAHAVVVAAQMGDLGAIDSLHKINRTVLSGPS